MKTWSEVKEVQPLASKILMNSIKKGRISHAYLIQGARGTGKEALALLLAKSLFCEQKLGMEPCHTCNVCKRIKTGNHPDVHWIMPVGQSIRKEQIRHLQKEFTYSGLESNQKLYIVTGSETLTLNAANRILKFLEEPSQETTAIMLTENSQSIIPTIRSRCQVIDLQPLNPALFREALLDSGISKTNATLLSALTNNLNDAFLLNQDEWFAKARKIVLQLMDMYIANPENAFLFIHDHWISHFKDKDQQEQGFDLLLLTFKDILYYHIGSMESMVVLSPNDERMERAILRFSQQKLIIILNALLETKQEWKQNVNFTLLMEQLALQIKR